MRITTTTITASVTILAAHRELHPVSSTNVIPSEGASSRFQPPYRKLLCLYRLLETMNGAKDAIDPSAAGQGPTSPTTVPLMAGANGNGTNSTTTNLASPTLLNKKRKKDGLKPIITTEGPMPG
ncbi:hypothetical protein F4677DRAFT_449378 [Hypoxylon crocopeplum]|nr:hypothetical protein F4677DRAFT_449378 [Hypoxylon crocopeplum]